MATLKKGAFLFFIFSVIIGCSISAKVLFAHQPEDMVVAYDAKNQVFSVGVIHFTDTKPKHFIKEIKIKLNGKEIITQAFLGQPDPKVQAVSYVITDAKNKDTLEIVAVCSNGQSLKRTFKVE